MSQRFADLKKVPEQPAARLLAAANAVLETKLSVPASASVAQVLTALEEAQAPVDMIRMLSVSLPPRECVWWACCAGRDIIGAEGQSACLSAAEAWVFEPNADKRARVQAVMDTANPNERASLCATAAFYAPGNMGDSEDLQKMPAPVGIVAACAFGINIQTIELGPSPQARFDLAIDRALDIARGGNGKVELRVSEPAATETPQQPETEGQS
ncbi:MAG: hypothetical protein AAGF60_05915 [Pseudomonadota bacterium]